MFVFSVGYQRMNGQLDLFYKSVHELMKNKEIQKTHSPCEVGVVSTDGVTFSENKECQQQDIEAPAVTNDQHIDSEPNSCAIS